MRLFAILDYLNAMTFPNPKSLFLVGGSWFLAVINVSVESFLELNWWVMVQWLLSVVLTIYGILDFRLKIKWKLRQDRQAAFQKKIEEARRVAEALRQAQDDTIQDDNKNECDGK